MRYNRNIDYGHFSEEPLAIQRLRRYEDVKYAAEIEALSKNFERLEN